MTELRLAQALYQPRSRSRARSSLERVVVVKGDTDRLSWSHTAPVHLTDNLTKYNTMFPHRTTQHTAIAYRYYNKHYNI